MFGVLGLEAKCPCSIPDEDTVESICDSKSDASGKQHTTNHNGDECYRLIVLGFQGTPSNLFDTSSCSECHSLSCRCSSATSPAWISREIAAQSVLAIIRIPWRLRCLHAYPLLRQYTPPIGRGKIRCAVLIRDARRTVQSSRSTSVDDSIESRA